MEGVGVAKIAQIMDLCNFLPDMELKGHRIMISDVNRPALQLSGYFKHFEQSRVQIIGTVEYTYLQQLDEENVKRFTVNLMGISIFRWCYFCRDLRPDDSFLKNCRGEKYSGAWHKTQYFRIHGRAYLLSE